MDGRRKNSPQADEYQASPEQPERLGGLAAPAVLPDGNGGFVPCPELLTEEELIRFLRVSEVSQAKDAHNVVENLKRMHGLPRIHICGKPLYPLEAIRKWIRERTTRGK